MTQFNIDVVSVKLSAQRAFLGEVRGDFRAVTISIDGCKVEVLVYVDRVEAKIYEEVATAIEAEMIADFDASCDIKVRFLRLDFPDVISDFGIWVFKRHEA